MNEKNFDPAFIPCGDSMEKMEEISEAALENVSGGSTEEELPVFSKKLLEDLLEEQRKKRTQNVEADPFA